MADDEIYRSEDGSGPFRFNEQVARVFPDMLRRSIPGYAASLEAIGSLAARYVRAGTNCYDLGCSLGAAMIERCREVVSRDTAVSDLMTDVDIVQSDIRDIEIVNASMVVLNYTLQFLDPGDRDGLLGAIAAGMNAGGILVLSEKVVDENPGMEELLVELHHEHKRRNNYSALEISRKRAALDNVLVPESVRAHRERLERTGFASSAVWLRYFNFVSIIALR